MLSNNPEVIAFIVILVAGALIFGIGSFLVRRESKKQPEGERTYETLDLSEAIAAVEKRPPPALVIPSVGEAVVEERSSAPDLVIPSVGAAEVERLSKAPDLVIPSVGAAGVEGQSADIALRLDMIERLVIVGQPWCIEELERNFLTDPDERLRNAAEDAILVIKTRG